MSKYELSEGTKAQLERMKEAKTFMQMVKAWGNDVGDGPEPEDVSQFSMIGQLMPEVWDDIGNQTHIHETERMNLDSKTKCLMYISAYCMRTAPKIAPHWVIDAKRLGASDEEIVEACVVAVMATAKAKLAEVDECITKIMNSDAYKKAKRGK